MADVTGTAKKPAFNFELFAPQYNRQPDIRTYQRLDSSCNEIRLLRIAKNSDTLRVTLENTSLDDAPVYDALSYCWGPPSERKSIDLDGEMILISKTLHNFLEALSKNGQQLPVWVDQLCINQSDTMERNSQVARMSDIYKNANCVRAWLGNSDVDIEYSLAYINAISQGHINDNPAIRGRAIEGLQQVCQRPYWRRMWIVQEIGLARMLLVYCGNDEVDFTDLCDTVDDLAPDLNLKYIHDLQQSSDKSTVAARGTEKSIIELVVAFASRNCEDARDKVYAVRSLSMDGHCIPVDYSKEVGQVVLDVLCRCSNSLRPVSLQESFDRTQLWSDFIGVFGISLEKLFNSQSDWCKAVVTALHSPELNFVDVLTDTQHTERPLPQSPLVLTALIDAKIRPGPTSLYGDHDGANRFRCTMEDFQPRSRTWRLKSMWGGTTYLTQIHHNYLRIVGFEYDYDNMSAVFQLIDDDELTAKQKPKRPIERFLLLTGHIQLCRYPTIPLRDFKVHYSLYAFLSLTYFSYSSAVQDLSLLQRHAIEIPADTLCNCNSANEGQST